MKTIVLIEDDAAIRDTFALALDPDQYRIISYDSGNPVLQNDIEHPDLFIIDKNISGTNGLNICRSIKGNRAYVRTPVVMISASPGIDKMAKEAGADDYLAKPFSLKNLREMVAKHTDPR